jgi:small conductance mechanosensitive channel
MSEDLFNIPLTLENLLVSFLRFLPSLIAALVIFVLGLILSVVVSRMLRITLERRDVKPEAVTVVVRLTYISIITLTLVIALQQIGFNLTAFLAGLGILGFTIGFALQDVSKNFVAGLLLLIQQPFNVGDIIEVNEYLGKVLEIDMRATRMRMLDGRIVLVPNGEIFTHAIINYSQAEDRRIEIPLGVASDSDLEFVRQTAVSAITGIPGLLSEPSPHVAYHTFGEYTIDLSLYFWIDTAETSVMKAKDAAVYALNSAFIKHSIEMPNPIQTVYLQSN